MGMKHHRDELGLQWRWRASGPVVQPAQCGLIAPGPDMLSTGMSIIGVVVVTDAGPRVGDAPVNAPGVLLAALPLISGSTPGIGEVLAVPRPSSGRSSTFFDVVTTPVLDSCKPLLHGRSLAASLDSLASSDPKARGHSDWSFWPDPVLSPRPINRTTFPSPSLQSFYTATIVRCSLRVFTLASFQFSHFHCLLLSDPRCRRPSLAQLRPDSNICPPVVTDPARFPIASQRQPCWLGSVFLNYCNSRFRSSESRVVHCSMGSRARR